MNKVIHKHMLSVAETTLILPVGSELLSCQFQGDLLQAWFAVNTDETYVENRRFTVKFTGDTFDSTYSKHVTTLQWNEFVVHVFEQVTGRNL